MSNFAVPDLRGRAPIQQGQGKDLSAYYLGQAIGKESVVLSTEQMPAHTHLIKANSTGANQVLPTNFYPSALIDSVSGESKDLYSDVVPDVSLNPGSVSTVGGTTAVNLVQPVLAIHRLPTRAEEQRIRRRNRQAQTSRAQICSSPAPARSPLKERGCRVG